MVCPGNVLVLLPFREANLNLDITITIRHFFLIYLSYNFQGRETALQRFDRRRQPNRMQSSWYELINTRINVL